MKRLILLLLGLSLFCGTALGSDWARIEKVVTQWPGDRQAILRTGLEDPLGDPSVQSLLELLLEHGFIVVPEQSAAATRESLVFDVRQKGAQTVVAVLRGSDGAILALERQGTPPPTSPVRPAPAPPPPAPSPPAESAPPSATFGMAGGLLETPGEPLRLAVIGRPDGASADLLLLSDNRIDRVRLSSQGVEPLVSCEPPVFARALHVDVVDLDGDGRQEAAVVMAEDVGDVEYGTSSRIHGWFPREEGGRCVFDHDLGGYLRAVDDQLFFQERAPFAPFAPGVFSVKKTKSGFRTEKTPAPWGKHALYSATPLPGGTNALAWVDEGRLALIDRESGKVLPGGRLVKGLGFYDGPKVAVRLKEPRFQSGFAREDRVLEEYHTLPRRVSFGPDGSAYTIDRGRRMPDIPLLGTPSGQDRLVRLSWTDRQVRLDQNFPGIDYFILDFALVDWSGRTAAILLLNEKPDGSGTSWLLVQEAP